MQMKELVEKIVRALVDSPEEVAVQEIEGASMNVLEVKVSKQDVGALIGKTGENINALRTIVTAPGKGIRGLMIKNYCLFSIGRDTGNTHRFGTGEGE